MPMTYSVVGLGDGNSMVSHKRLQHYKRYYGKTLMTGLYGCRWHRYQQSRDNTSIWDLGWFCLLVLLFLFTLMWLFYWIVAVNDQLQINELISEKTVAWQSWHTLMLVVSALTFSYVAVLFLLALLHTGYGHEMYMHKVHKGMLLLILTACITAANAATSLWPDGWMLIYLAIIASWPFIHLAVVAVMTLLTLVIARRWIYLYTIGARIATLAVFVVVILFIYISPLLVQPPCVRDVLTLPSQPSIIAHRGGAALAPENTLLAFQMSNQYDRVIGFQCDVRVSLDGVPFLMHDSTLIRTTNVALVFPERQEEPAHNFNITDLHLLNAGSWFIEANPQTYADIPDVYAQIKNQTIPTLEEVLLFIKTTDKSLMINIEEGPSPDHPHATDYKEIVVETILNSGIKPEKVLWQYYDENIGNFSLKFRRSTNMALPSAQVSNDSSYFINLPYREMDLNLISEYKMKNLSVNVYTVNSLWLYSLCWCTGVSSVTTDQVLALSTLQDPIWVMSPPMYLIMWVCIDVVSAILILCIFIYNRVRNSGAIFNPETLSLQAMQHRISQTKQNRNMKEKLLYAAESIQDMENGISGIVTPSTPATPATIETPTTPLSPTTPNLTIHGAQGQHMGNISFSPASGFFNEKTPIPAPVGVDKSGGQYNEALSPQAGREETSDPHLSNGAVMGGEGPLDNTMPTQHAITDYQVRGFFESPPLKTEHYRSLSDNITPQCNVDNPRPHSDVFVNQKPVHIPINRNLHFRSNSATIPKTILYDGCTKAALEEKRSASVSSDMLPKETLLRSDFEPEPAAGLYDAQPTQTGSLPDPLHHHDIGIEVS